MKGGYLVDFTVLFRPGTVIACHGIYLLQAQQVGMRIDQFCRFVALHFADIVLNDNLYTPQFRKVTAHHLPVGRPAL